MVFGQCLNDERESVCQASGRNTVAADACFQITWPEACRFPGAWKVKKIISHVQKCIEKGRGWYCGRVYVHASIGADAVGIEEFKHRCSVSGIFFQHRYALDSLTWNWLGEGALFLRLCGVHWGSGDDESTTSAKAKVYGMAYPWHQNAPSVVRGGADPDRGNGSKVFWHHALRMYNEVCMCLGVNKERVT
jgi:hypothetical protein